MKRTFLIGVAAGALLAGANVMASAQGMNQQQQPGASSGGMERGSTGMQQKGSAGSEQKANEKGLNSRAQAPDKGMSGQAQPEPKAQGQMEDKGKAQKGQAQDQMKKGTTGQAQQGQMDQKGQRAQEKSGSQDKSAQSPSSSKSSTSAQSGAKGGNKAASLTTEQKTKIRTTVLRGSNAPRVTNVNFSVSVGTVIPASVHFATLPPVLVEIFPEWRGYDYIIVEERIVIIEPSTRKIVTILVV